MNIAMSLKKLAQIKKHDFAKELKNFEYETKFDIKNNKLSSFEILKKIRNCFKNNQQFVLCEIKGGDKLLTHVSFFLRDNIEYSLFRYHAARMVKIKKHRIIKGMPFNIFKNDEQLIIDKGDFSSKLKDLQHRFKRHNYRLVDLDYFLQQKSALTDAGEMIKNRVKDFVFNARDGRIYAVAVTFCKTKNSVQKQLEVEYAGYLPGFKNQRGNIEKQVIAGVQELSRYIYKHFPTMLKPSVERKFEFVKRNNPKT